MSRINLPSEERIKSIDSTSGTGAAQYENTDVVVDSTLGQILESDGTNWTKLFDSTSIKASINPNIADYEGGDIVFDTQSDTIKFKASGVDTEWTRLQSKNHLSLIDTTTEDPENFEAGDGVIDYTGDIYKVTGNAGARIFEPWSLRSAIQLESDSSSADIAPYRSGDIILTSDLKLLKKEFNVSTSWTILKDLDKVEYVAPKFSVVGPRSGTDSDGNVATGTRSIFERSRGMSHWNAGTAVPLEDLETYKEIHVINSNVEINWNNARGIGINRWQDVVGRLIFPSAEVYNRTKDSVRNITFTTFQVLNFDFAYEYTTSGGATRYVKTFDVNGIFTRNVVINPADNKPLFRNGNGVYSTAEHYNGGTIYANEADADTDTNPSTSNFIVVDSTTKAFVTTGQAYQDPPTNSLPVDDAYLGTQKQSLNIVARLDYDDGNSNLSNVISIGYRQKAVIHVVDSNEADQWGFSIADNDQTSEFDNNKTLMLVSIESI